MSAPIAVFTYNRPLHAKKLLESLAQNIGIGDSEVRIYCDGPRDEDDISAVSKTREIVKANAPKGAQVVERDQNFGLGKSIITGVSELCDLYGQVIVLEDDLVLSPHTLSYLNNALRYYEHSDSVMHISAYMFPVHKKLPPVFFYREATCWGWATWRRAWKYFEPNAEELLRRIDEKERRQEFNIDGSMDFYNMLCNERDKKISSWAIRWYGSIFLRNGLALHPGRSFVQNCGFDGSGVHCNVDSRFDVQLSDRIINEFPDTITESEFAKEAMIEYRIKTRDWKVLGNLAMRRIVGKMKSMLWSFLGRT